jgi:membrane-associated HD superfamily phosphohydrolase
VTYFYRKAVEAEGEDVDPEPFTYPGPRPQSKETAIAMLADSSEAMVRASPDRSPEAIDRIVDQVIGERLAEGQLDDADLTMRDLRAIAAAFKAALRGVYHPRVEYPAPTTAERRALKASRWMEGVEPQGAEPTTRAER